METTDIREESSVLADDISLRPDTLDSYIGQDDIKKVISVLIQSAKHRKTTLDHILFYGPPGLGKTTMANIIANEMGTHFKGISAPTVSKPADIVSVLMTIEEGDILFIDEIHRLPKNIEENLYSAMEDFFIDIIISKDNQESKAIRLPIPKFTLIGATTEVGSLSSPLRDRFGYVGRLEMYNEDDIGQIIKNAAKKLDLHITKDGIKTLASASRGTPRIALRLTKRMLDFSIANKAAKIDSSFVISTLTALKIDKIGLDSNDIRILSAINNQFKGGPVGIETLAAYVGEDKTTIETVCEPYLLQKGFIQKTPRGRVITDTGKSYLSSYC